VKGCLISAYVVFVISQKPSSAKEQAIFYLANRFGRHSAVFFEFCWLNGWFGCCISILRHIQLNLAVEHFPSFRAEVNLGAFIRLELFINC